MPHLGETSCSGSTTLTILRTILSEVEGDPEAETSREGKTKKMWFDYAHHNKDGAETQNLHGGF